MVREIWSQRKTGAKTRNFCLSKKIYNKNEKSLGEKKTKKTAKFCQIKKMGKQQRKKPSAFSPPWFVQLLSHLEMIADPFQERLGWEEWEGWVDRCRRAWRSRISAVGLEGLEKRHRVAVTRGPELDPVPERCVVGGGRGRRVLWESFQLEARMSVKFRFIPFLTEFSVSYLLLSGSFIKKCGLGGVAMGR